METAKPQRKKGQRRQPEDASAPDTDPNLERKGHILVYTGPAEPFDAVATIEQVREERTGS